MTFIDRILARFGYVKASSVEKPMTEIIVFHDRKLAAMAGFVGQGHPEHKHLLAWWPALGPAGIMMRTSQRVTVPSALLEIHTHEGSVRNLLKHRHRVWGDRAFWVEI